MSFHSAKEPCAMIERAFSAGARREADTFARREKGFLPLCLEDFDVLEDYDTCGNEAPPSRLSALNAYTLHTLAMLLLGCVVVAVGVMLGAALLCYEGLEPRSPAPNGLHGD